MLMLSSVVLISVEQLLAQRDQLDRRQVADEHEYCSGSP